MSSYSKEKVTREGKNGKYEVDFFAGEGNLTKDVPEYKEVMVDGKPKKVINGMGTRLAFDNYVPNESGEGYKKGDALFLDFTLWGERCKFFQNLKKGERLTVRGVLKDVDYEYKGKDGEIKKGTSPHLTIENFEVIPRYQKQESTSYEKDAKIIAPTPPEMDELEEDDDVPF